MTRRREVVELSKITEWTAGSQERNETYYIRSRDGNGLDVEVTFEEIVDIHELTGRVIAEKERKEVRYT